MERGRALDEHLPRTASDQAVAAGPGPSASNPGRLLCDLFIEALPVSGASITIVGRSGDHCVVGVSDDRAAALEAAQFELGVGPHWDALRTRRPAFLLRATASEAWPPLGLEIGRLGVESLIALPLRLGPQTIGVVDLHSCSPGGHWSKEMIDVGIDLAASISGRAARLAAAAAAEETVDSTAGTVELRREVHQATGILMALLQTDAASALLRLRAHAFASATPLEALAREIVEHRLRLPRT